MSPVFVYKSPDISTGCLAACQLLHLTYQIVHALKLHQPKDAFLFLFCFNRIQKLLCLQNLLLEVGQKWRKVIDFETRSAAVWQTPVLRLRVSLASSGFAPP